jgi:hypothetical protein
MNKYTRAVSEIYLEDEASAILLMLAIDEQEWFRVTPKHRNNMVSELFLCIQ